MSNTASSTTGQISKSEGLGAPSTKTTGSVPAGTATSAPYSGGLFSKIFGFGTSSQVVDKHTAAIDEKHDFYHPGMIVCFTCRQWHPEPCSSAPHRWLHPLAELRVSPKDAGSWETHTGNDRAGPYALMYWVLKFDDCRSNKANPLRRTTRQYTAWL